MKTMSTMKTPAVRMEKSPIGSNPELPEKY